MYVIRNAHVHGERVRLFIYNCTGNTMTEYSVPGPAEEARRYGDGTTLCREIRDVNVANTLPNVLHSDQHFIRSRRLRNTIYNTRANNMWCVQMRPHVVDVYSVTSFQLLYRCVCVRACMCACARVYARICAHVCTV